MGLVCCIKIPDAVAMKDVDPYSVDFSALRVLELVHSYGSFSRAAETLGVTQSSVSYTIERLRKAFDDPLFVRQGGQVVSTQKCDELAGQAAMILAEFNRMTLPTDFDPSTASGVITIACNYYERAVIIPDLVRVMRTKAPNLKLKIISSFSSGRQRLSQGESDILIGPMRVPESGFFGRKLLTDHYTVIVPEGHALQDGVLDVETYAAMPQIIVTYGSQWRSRYLIEIEDQGLVLNSVVEVPSPAMIPDLIRDTDLIATVPARVAAVMGSDVRTIPCPLPAPFDVMAYWTERTHKSPMHKWVREELSKIVRRLVMLDG